VAEIVDPFVESVIHFFSKVLECQAMPEEVTPVGGRPTPLEVTALTGLVGPVRGAVALSFPVPVAVEVTTRVVGMETSGVDETVVDVLGEAVNVVAGSAKAKLRGENQTPINLTLPSVVKGTDYEMASLPGTRWFDVPFSSELGPFHLLVAFAPGNEHGGAG
jgi:chemotaxis protein CheX